jgi:hypothetical protein
MSTNAKSKPTQAELQQQMLKLIKSSSAGKDPAESSAPTPPTDPGNDLTNVAMPSGKPKNTDAGETPPGTDVIKGKEKPAAITENEKQGAEAEASVKVAGAKLLERMAALAADMQKKAADAQVKSASAKPAAAPAAPTQEEQEKITSASAPDGSMFADLGSISAHELLTKVGALVCASEEGRRFAQSLVEEKAGADLAEAVIKSASHAAEDQSELIKSAAAQVEDTLAAVAYEQDLTGAVLDWMRKHASADYEVVTKLATSLQSLMLACPDVELEGGAVVPASTAQELIKRGAADAAMMAQAGGMGGGEIPPELLAQLEAGGAPQEGGDIAASPEEIAMMIEQLIASGQIDPQTGAALMELLAQAGGGAMPDEAAAAADVQKMASLAGVDVAKLFEAAA